MKTAITLCLVLLAIYALPSDSFGENDKPLKKLLEGFEDKAENNNTDLDDLLDGFDDTKNAEIGLDDVLDGFEDTENKATGKNAESDDDILGGFDDEENGTKTGSKASVDSRLPFSLDGYLKLAGTYNFRHGAPDAGETDWRGLSKLRAEVLAQAEYKPTPNWKIIISGKGHYDTAYVINGRDDYTDDILDNNETELELRDTYVSGSLNRNLDIKLGRQIVVWGKSDNIRITDVLNPLDFREPGLTDIEDLRLPVAMSRADYYFGDFSFTGIAIHEIRFDKLPAYGSDFYPFPNPPPDEDIPNNTLENTEFAAALNGIFSGWDMSLYWANIHNDAARMEMTQNLPMPAFRRTHDRIHMLGAALNIVYGNWLLKTEAAYFADLQYFNTGDKKFSRIDGLVGFEYTGLKDTALSLELADRHILGFDDDLEKSPDGVNEDESQSAIRLTRNFLNDTLTLTILANLFGINGDDGAFERLTLEYDVTDAFSILGGVIIYQSGDIFEAVDENDRLIFEAKYFF